MLATVRRVVVAMVAVEEGGGGTMTTGQWAEHSGPISTYYSTCVAGLNEHCYDVVSEREGDLY